MKKAILLLLSLFIVSLAFAGSINNVAISWSATVGGLTGNPSCGTYNWATGHFLVCDYTAAAGLKVRIASGTDGSLTGGTLSTTGLTLGTLGVFSICAGPDGVVYGGGNPVLVVLETRVLYRWANEGDGAPTQQEPAQPLGVGMQFPRAMDVIGTGTSTIVGVTGDSTDYNVTFLTTTDGTTFSVTDYTTVASLNEREQIKGGVALVPGMAKVYGTKADGAGQVCRMDSAGIQTWAAAAGFTPPNSYTAPPTGLGQASPIGYAPNLNVVFVLGSSDVANDYLSVLDGDTGAILAQTQIGQNIAIYGYGAIDVDDELGEAYFIARAVAVNNFVCGKITFDPWLPPTKANVWNIYE